MPTTVVKTIKSSGGDYTSLSAWEAARQADLTVSDTIEQADVYSLDAGACNVNGWTTSSTQFVVIAAASTDKHAGVWNSGKARMKSSAGFGVILTIGEEYVRVQNMQVFQDTGSYTSLVRIIDTVSATSDIRFENCILRGVGATAFANGGFFQEAGTSTIRNCVIYGCSGAASSGVYLSRGNSINPTSTIQNVTIASNGVYGINANLSATVTATNCYSGNNSTDAYNTGGSAISFTRTTCRHSSATSYSGSTGSTAHSTANFTNVTSGSEDYHLVSGSALIDVGTDLSGTFTTDFEGNTRGASWDVGADEFISSGSTFNETGSGGILGGSQADPNVLYFPSITSAGASLGSQADPTVLYSIEGAAGAALGSSGIDSTVVVEIGNGGALGGSQADSTLYMMEIGSAGSIVGSAALLGGQFDEFMNGGLAAVSGADLFVILDTLTSGGVFTNGADLDFVIVQIDPLGGSLLGSSADSFLEFIIDPSGGLLVSGVADLGAGSLIRITGTMQFGPLYVGSLKIETLYQSSISIEPLYQSSLNVQ